MGAITPLKGNGIKPHVTSKAVTLNKEAVMSLALEKKQEEKFSDIYDGKSFITTYTAYGDTVVVEVIPYGTSAQIRKHYQEFLRVDEPKNDSNWSVWELSVFEAGDYNGKNSEGAMHLYGYDEIGSFDAYYKNAVYGLVRAKTASKIHEGDNGLKFES